jgi:glycosyltransferase involved in cell wall biosynthesis
MKKFKVSVIIPVYNAEKYIKAAIESALLQNEVGEVIVVEDKSPDNSLQICVDMALKNTRIRLYQHPDKQNHGAGASRNVGIMNARFDYIAFLDADDYYLKDRFKKDKELFSEFQYIDGVYNALGTDYYEEVENAMIPKRFITTITKNIEPKDLFSTLVRGESGWIHSNSITVKKSVFDKMDLFDTYVDLVEDALMWIKVSSICNLMGGEIVHPVAMRGVHLQNRINNTAILHHNKTIMFSKLLEWAIEKKLPLDKRRLLWSVYYQTNVNNLSRNRIKRLASAIIEFYRYPFLLGYSEYYKIIPFLTRIIK